MDVLTIFRSWIADGAQIPALINSSRLDEHCSHAAGQQTHSSHPWPAKPNNSEFNTLNQLIKTNRHWLQDLLLQLIRGICRVFPFPCPFPALSLGTLQLPHLRLWPRLGWVCLFVLRLETSENKCRSRCGAAMLSDSEVAPGPGVTAAPMTWVRAQQLLAGA